MAKNIRMMKEQDGLGIKIPDLARQKQILKKSYLDFLGTGIFIFALTILVFVVGLLVEDSAHSKRIVFIAVPGLLWITIVFAFFFLVSFTFTLPAISVITANPLGRLASNNSSTLGRP